MFDDALFGTLGISQAPFRTGTSLEALEGMDPAARSRLESVYLPDVRLGPKEVVRLARLALPSLRRLDLTCTRLGEKGLFALTEAAWAGKLDALDLASDNVGKGVANLVAFPRLVDLRLCENELGDDEALLLAKAPCMPRLRRLDLASNKLGAKGLVAIVEHLKAIEQLDFGGNKLGEDAIPILVAAKLSKLTHVVPGGRVSEAGMDRFREALPNVTIVPG